MHVKIFILVSFIYLLPSMMTGQSCDINGKKHYNFNDIITVLDKNNCKSCHFKGSYQSTWHYEDYESVFQESNCSIPIISRGNPNKSSLVDKLNGGPTECGSPMLQENYTKMSDQDLLIIESWITYGAPEFCLHEFSQIQDILSKNHCNSCHSNTTNWSFEKYTEIFYNAENSDCNHQIINKFNASNSLLFQKLSSITNICGDIMTDGGKPLDNIDIIAIRDWINAGAPESSKILPLTLTDFSAEQISDSKIELIWKTAQEFNTSYFEIQRSWDGIQFSTIDKVKSYGGINQNSVYPFIHEDIKIGYNYYRLKMVDLDGNFSYSPVRVVRISNEKEIFSIYPNPIVSKKELTVEWYSIDKRDRVKLKIMDFTGRQFLDHTIQNGINKVPLPELHEGLYYISIEDYYFKINLKKLVVLNE